MRDDAEVSEHRGEREEPHDGLDELVVHLQAVALHREPVGAVDAAVAARQVVGDGRVLVAAEWLLLRRRHAVDQRRVGPLGLAPHDVAARVLPRVAAGGAVEQSAAVALRVRRVAVDAVEAAVAFLVATDPGDGTGVVVVAVVAVVFVVVLVGHVLVWIFIESFSGSKVSLKCESAGKNTDFIFLGLLSLW